MVYYSDDLKDLVNQIFDVFAETKPEKKETSTETPKRVSKSELLEEIKKEVTKQVEQATHGVYKEIDKLDNRMSDFNERLDDLAYVVDDLKYDFYGDEPQIEPGDEEEDDDYAFENTIINSVKREFGLDGFTISDGNNAALVIPLDDDFDLNKFARNLVLKSLDNEDK